MRRRTRLVSGVALLVAGGLVAAAGATSAQEAAGGEVEAFTLGARAFAVRVLYDTPGSLPIGPLVELTAPESRTTLGTGDTGQAFSAVGYPGPVLAGVPQIAATSGVDLSFVPPYPLAVTASTSGPTEVRDTTAAPGSSMEATADDGVTEAVTRTPALGLPGVLELGSLRATARSEHLDDGTVRTTSSTDAGRIVLLGGLLTIDNVRSTVTATSDGGTPKVSARTTVTDAELLGVPVEITADGIELAPGQTVAQGVVASLLEPLGGPNGLLAATGLRIRAGAVREDVGTDQAVVGAEGLTLEVNGALELAALDQVLGALPPLPPIEGLPVQPTDAIGLLQANQVRSFNVGQATATLTARGPAGEAVLPEDGGVALPEPGVTAPLDDFGSLPPLPSPGTGTGTTGGTATGGTGGSSGPLPLPALPASGALVALGGALVASVGFRRFADVVLDPVPAATACSLALDPEATDD